MWNNLFHIWLGTLLIQTKRIKSPRGLGVGDNIRV